MDQIVDPEFSYEILKFGYLQGSFPMANEYGKVDWFVPYERALLPIEGLHVSRSLRKVIRSRTFEITFDTAFESVMRSCLRPSGNWISEQMITAYCMAFHNGWAHSCEVWRDGDLVGGVYGLQIGTCFSAESMFHRVTNASKVALWACIERCREVGYEMFDAQIMNPHLQTLGAFTMPQSEFLQKLHSGLDSVPQPF